MAKHKNTTRLFEVMQASRAKGKGFSLSTPSWWFKNRPANPGVNAGVNSGVNVGANPSPMPVPIIPPTPVSMMASEDDAVHAPPAPRKPGVDLKLDRDRKQIHFKVTYTNVILTAFSVVVIISLAYVFGKSGHTSPTPAYAGETIEQVKKKPASVKVTDLSSKPAKAVEPEGLTPSVPGSTKPAQLIKNAMQPPSVTQQAYVDAVRVSGRNYIVVQAYPDKQAADEVKALLEQSGIPTTVENGLTGSYTRSWWCVVTQTGFDRIRANADYDNLIKRLIAISDQNYSSKSKFKKFAPLTYKWRAN